ncbi:hypothetical protein HA451_12240 [Aeromonas veronii]|uniref:hypothetical protein n=1 Tax=Aeromonas veronii TaxID=654 RepID=UPI00143037C3|nr:hypothetical protein [Aeromonas veronii]NJI23811.1 hypothetical protein [Aeromonas veronii]NJI34177.1 hypothetical protein [Aeromonas veronii]
MSEDLEHLLREIKRHPKYKSYNGKFPTLSTLTRFPEKNLPIIVEQGERLISAKINDVHFDDLALLKEQFISDIHQFLTEASIKINSNIIASYGQSVITSNALYHIACSQQYKNKYSDIDLLMNKVEFNYYSISFILRLAIENKLKSMLGFEYSDVTKIVSGKKKTFVNTREFPVNKILNFLSNNDLLSTPCSFLELKNIYSWSCRFAHDATKEYVWLRLKALSSLHDLFDFNFIEKNNQHKNHSNVISYLKAGLTLDQVMKKINNDPKFKGHHKLYLLESRFDDNFGFYNSKSKTFH